MHIRKDGSLLLLGKQRSWEPRSWLRFCVDDLLVNSSNGTVISDTVRVREFIVNKCFDEEVLDNKVSGLIQYESLWEVWYDEDDDVICLLGQSDPASLRRLHVPVCILPPHDRNCIHPSVG